MVLVEGNAHQPIETACFAQKSSRSHNVLFLCVAECDQGSHKSCGNDPESAQAPRRVAIDANPWGIEILGSGKQPCGTSALALLVAPSNLCNHSDDVHEVEDIEVTQEEGSEFEKAKRIVRLLNASLDGDLCTSIN